ncbi:hypothetical protein [Nocardia sp. NPDC046763]
MADEIICGLCGKQPVGDGGQMCGECRARVEAVNAADPYPLVPDLD